MTLYIVSRNLLVYTPTATSRVSKLIFWLKRVMGKERRSSNGKKMNMGGIVEKLQKISFTKGRYSYVPLDVKEGHFAVMAVDAEEPKRFVVPLRYLAHPRFQKLLDQAAEEYGFDREGALAIPCTPCEIETILADSNSRFGKNSWGSCNSTVQIY